jgi:uncharacterized protein
MKKKILEFFIIIIILIEITITSSIRIEQKIKLIIKESKIKNSGLGVFAGEEIKKGTIIEKCPLIKLKIEDINKKSLINNYFFKTKDSNNSMVSLVFGYCSIYNHDKDKCNIYHYQDDLMYIVSIRNIKKGEELYLDYGHEYWSFDDNTYLLKN